jgi:hypothetical protein
LVAAAFARAGADSASVAVNELVDQLMADRLQRCRADGTFATYQSGWSSYLEICSKYKIQALPVSETKLLSYTVLVHHEKNLLAGTIRNYLCAIAFVHKISGLDDPRKDSPLLKLVLDGCRRHDRDHGYEKRLRLGISGTMLKVIIKSLNMSSFRAARWAAWACTTYYGGFRANELLQTKHGGLRCLWKHFTFGTLSTSFMTLKQYFSKSRQFGPSIIIPICFTGESSCPVTRMKHYRSFFSNQVDLDHSPAFMSLDGTAYTYNQAMSDTRYYLRQCGYSGSNYGTHSFRIGMASEAGRLGMPGWVIQLLGRWNSECYRVYIQTDLSVLADYSKQLRGTGD